MGSPKALICNQQNYKKLGQKDHQRSRRGLPQTDPPFCLLIVVVRNNFAQVKDGLLTSHLASMCTFSAVNLGEKQALEKFILRCQKQYILQYES